MQEVNEDLVSIIIPCYNAENFITETIMSVINQSHKNIEIFIIDDGSKDNSKNKIEQLTESNLHYIYQPNQGVSSARNNGFNLSNGKYIVFLDSDDFLAPRFIESRLFCIKSLDFSFGRVKEFSSLKNSKIWSNHSDHLLKDLLLFNSEINTCPSGFLFKKTFLLNKNITFNKKLQSTADKFFLLEVLLAGGTYGYVYDTDDTDLKYRIHDNSMSNMLTQELISDNEKYFKLVKKKKSIPKGITNEFKFKMTYILCGANKKINNWKPTCYYLIYLLLFFPRKSIAYLFSLKIN